MIDISIDGVELLITNLELLRTQEQKYYSSNLSKYSIKLYAMMLGNKLPLRIWINQNIVENDIGVIKNICVNNKDALLNIKHPKHEISQLALLKLRYFDKIEIPVIMPDEESKMIGIKGKDYDEVLRYVEQGKKIMAIKTYRALTGFGLRESKDAIDFIIEGLEGKI